MKVFFSWSGDRSKAVAEGLSEWLEQMIQAVDPWISTGINKGARWLSEIAERLDEAKVGIVCLTSGNLTNPWILFEAGALSKTKDSYVCTFLLDVKPGDVEPPLGQFQHTLFTRKDVFKLVQDINQIVNKSGERFVKDQILTKTFDTSWTELEAKLTEIKNRPKPKTHRRPERELLEEILEIMRHQEHRTRKEREESAEKVAQYLAHMTSLDMALTPNPWLSGLKTPEKKVTKGPVSVPTGPLFNKEPSNVEPSKE